MAWYFIVLSFIFSFVVLHWLSSGLVSSLVQIGKYLRWREFMIAFFIMAFATSLPNLFVDFNAAIQGKPEIALGDIIGGNLIDLTLVLALAVFFSRKGLSAESEMVQKSAFFTSAIAVLPLLLIFDSTLSRADGLILILAFIAYTWWLFSKKERFQKTYGQKQKKPISGFPHFLKNLLKVVVIVILLLFASQIVVYAAEFFSKNLGIPLSLIGILVVALGNSFPEIYFSVTSARKESNWMVLGDLMGSVIICSTMVLGLIALIFPFEIKDISPFFTARIFLIIAALVSLLAISSGRKITKREGMILLFVYIIFLIVEIFMP